MTKPPTRLHDWPVRLEAFVRQRMAMPFAWGSNDCATFASDAVLAITGQDPAPKGLRSHTTAKQAYRNIARHGGLDAIGTAALGVPIAPVLACVGDVLLVKVGKRDAFAISNGATAMAPSARGLVNIPLASARMAWRIA
jgi:hypothetical protein